MGGVPGVTSRIVSLSFFLFAVNAIPFSYLFSFACLVCSDTFVLLDKFGSDRSLLPPTLS